MKKYLIILGLLLMPFTAFALTTVPWVRTNGNSETPIYLTDLIGIGITPSSDNTSLQIANLTHTNTLDLLGSTSGDVSNIRFLDHGDTTVEASLTGASGGLTLNNDLIVTGSNGARSLEIHTGGIESFYNSSNSEVFRIQGSGNNLLFTTIAGGYIDFTGADVNFSDNTGIQWGANDFWIGSASQHTLTAYTNGSPRFIIDPNGNVGIGLAIPSSILHVQKDLGIGETNGNQVRIQSNVSGDTAGIHLTDNVTSDAFLSFIPSATTTLRYLSFDGGSGSTAMAVVGNGNVGVGTTTPSAILTVQGSGTSDDFMVASSTAKSVFGITSSGWQYSSGPIPSVSSCGTGTGTVTGNNNLGTITTATAATSCTLTFNPPVPTGYTLSCNVTDNSLVGFADISSTSTSAVVFGISSALTGGNLFYNCGLYK